MGTRDSNDFTRYWFSYLMLTHDLKYELGKFTFHGQTLCSSFMSTQRFDKSYLSKITRQVFTIPLKTHHQKLEISGTLQVEWKHSLVNTPLYFVSSQQKHPSLIGISVSHHSKGQLCCWIWKPPALGCRWYLQYHSFWQSGPQGFFPTENVTWITFCFCARALIQSEEPVPWSQF